MKFFITSILLISSLYALGTSSQNQENFLHRYLGTIESGSKMLPSITIFQKKDGVIRGKYVMYEKDRLSFGELKVCKKVDEEILECIWSDEYGSGTLSISFSRDLKRIVGEWNIKGEDRKYLWNGLLIEKIK